MSLNLKPLFFALLLLHSIQASAIVNIENMRIDTTNKIEGMDSTINLDISGDNGNTQKIQAGLGARAQWYAPQGTHFIVFNYEYGESADIKDTDKAFLHGRSINYLSDTQAWEVFTQIESNPFTRLELRALVGAGLRWELSKSEGVASYAGVGLFRSREELDPESMTTDTDTVYNTRLNTYLVLKYKISPHARLVNTLYYQPDINDSSDYRLLEQLGLQMDITEKLSFKISLDVSHDSMAPQTIRATDTRYRTGFEYNF